MYATFATMQRADLPIAEGLRTKPLWFTRSVRGGCLEADIEVHGKQNLLWSLLHLIGKRVTIRNRFHRPVWWGIVEDVMIGEGVQQDGVSIRDMHNRVKMAYTYEQLGETVDGETDWAEHAESIATLGFVKETLETLEIAADEDLANQKLQTYLEKFGLPIPMWSEGTGEPVAIIRASGEIKHFLWKYYSQDLGLAEHEAESSGQQALGVGFTSNEVGFAAGGKISELNGKFAEFPDSGVIRISGSGNSNDRLTRIQGTDSREPVEFDASGISFEANDDLVDQSDSALGFLSQDDWIEVTGTSSNNGYWYINDAAADHVVVRGASAITNELDPPGAIIRRGGYIETTSLLNHERPGLGTVTVQYYGLPMTQPFQIPTATGWTLAAVELRLGRHGMPTDLFQLDVCEDDGVGGSGAVIATATIAPALLAEDSLATEKFEFDNTDLLAPATTYHLKLSRTGDMDAENYYLVEIDEATAGGLLLWTGGEWHGHIPDEAKLSYRVLGAQETTDQIAAIVEACGQFVDEVEIVNSSGKETNQWRDGSLTAYDEIMALLDIGTSDGEPLFCDITYNGIMRITKAPPSTAQTAQWLSNGTWKDERGRPLEEGVLPVGQWVARPHIPAAFAYHYRMSPKLLEEARYDCETGQIQQPRFQGEPTPDQILI